MIEIPLWFIIFVIMAIGLGIVIAIHEKYGETIANIAFSIYMMVFIVCIVFIIMAYIQNIIDGIGFLVNLVRFILSSVQVKVVI